MKNRKVLFTAAAVLMFSTISLQAKADNTHLINPADDKVADKIFDHYIGDNNTGLGGAILYVDVKRAVENAVFTNNDVTTENNKNKYGGAIYFGVTTNSDEYGLSITGSSFSKNKAKFGGALFNDADGNVEITKSSFDSNTSTGSGGAIYSNSRSNLTISDSSFNGNSATGGNGGAIYLAGNSNLEISNTDFTNNSSSLENGGGGAIYSGTGSTLTVSDSNFEGNTTENGFGGAILSQGSLTLTNGALSNNKSNYGGAVYSAGQSTINGTTFSNNESKKNGGAIYSTSDGKLDITNAKFSGNKTVGTTQAKDSNGQGGAIWSNCETNITNTDFDNNTAKKAGGAFFQAGGGSTITGGSFTNNSAANFGGAIYVNADNINIDGTTFSENNVYEKYQENLTGRGGALWIGKNSSAEIKNAGFSGNIAGNGGAIFTDEESTGTLSITDSAFNNNKAEGKYTVPDSTGYGHGGAILASGKTNITNSSFSGNNANGFGGALFQDGDENAELTIEKSTFSNNSASAAGAITSSAKTTITDSTFDSNKATHGLGGAIFNGAESKEFKLENSDFTRNSALRGGAIYAQKNTQSIVSGGTFSGNTVTGLTDADGNPVYGQGGAIFTNRDGATLNVEGAVFDGNSAENEGGAIWSGNKTNITGSTFANNRTTGTVFHADTPDYKTDAEGGGAIFVGSNSATVIESSQFVDNSSATVGGAIATRSNADPEGTASSLSIDSSTFSGNTAAKNGGAIASYVAATITDSSFTGNSAGEKGGAIWANGDVTVTATDSDVVFAGNSAADGGDIYMDDVAIEGVKKEKRGELTLNASENHSITLEDGVSGKLGEDDTKYNININDEENTGTVTFKGEVKNAEVKVQAGTLHLAEGNSLNNSTVTMADGTTLDTTDNVTTSYAEDVIKTAEGASNLSLKTDISSATGKTDSFAGLGSTAVNLEDFNVIPDTLVSKGYISKDELAGNLGIDPKNLTIKGGVTHRALSPLRWLEATSTEEGIGFAPTGNKYKDFNPAVMAGPIAAQLGGYLNQLNSYEEAFRNMDMYMLMTKKERQAMKLRNKYAAADGNLVFDPTGTPYSDKGVWMRPYATFENVPLKGGPRVSNVAYGSYFGAESELYDLGNGWDGMYGIYAGYNGSHQTYDHTGIYQNGGTLGLVGMAYKGNFFTGLTINAGANVGEADTLYGQDNFTLLMAGIANKTGYNWELAEGKFIIQPSLMLSYSFVNTFDYKTASGINVDSDALHAVTFEPGIKFIGNLKNGWQPYAGVSVVWNILDKTKFYASDATLPELSVKPFVKYGVGVRKTWGERFTGFFQTYFTNGGRNGVGFQLGFRMTLGKGGNAIKKGQTPELPKTQLKLSRNK